MGKRFGIIRLRCVLAGKILIRNGLLWCVKCEGPADWPGLFVTYCFNYTPWSITTMPTIFRRYVVDGVLVRGIFWLRGS
jgi:hypothetical protein